MRTELFTAGPSVEVEKVTCPLLENPFAALDGLAKDVIGRSHAEAAKMIEDAGFTSRVESIDGVMLMVTSDANPRRLSLSLEDGFVVSARRK